MTTEDPRHLADNLLDLLHTVCFVRGEHRTRRGLSLHKSMSDVSTSSVVTQRSLTCTRTPHTAPRPV